MVQQEDKRGHAYVVCLGAGVDVGMCGCDDPDSPRMNSQLNTVTKHMQKCTSVSGQRVVSLTSRLQLHMLQNRGTRAVVQTRLSRNNQCRCVMLTSAKQVLT